MMNMKNYATLIIVGVIVLFCMGGCVTYNSLVSKQEVATQAFSDVQAAYQRRSDLLPNAAKIVKAYAKHENETFKEITEARAKASQITVDANNLTPEKMKQYQEAQGDVSNALGKLMMVSEQYPDLKASKNFEDLQVQVEGCENRINYARQKYNQTVQEYNVSVRSFPNNILSGVFGFQTMTKFEAEKGADKAPNLDI